MQGANQGLEIGIVKKHPAQKIGIQANVSTEKLASVRENFPPQRPMRRAQIHQINGAIGHEGEAFDEFHFPVST